MEAKETNSVMPSGSFLMDRKYFHFDDFNHSVCLMEFGYYNENGKLCCIYHLLIDGVFTRVFTDYLMAMSYLKKFA